MTEREALRLLHLDPGCSRDQLRRAYLDMVKVWHPDRFQTDSKLRAKAERTLQSINDAYALLQGRVSSSTAAPVADAEKAGQPDRAREESRAHAAASASRAAPRLTRHLVVAAAAGTALGVVFAVATIVRWNVQPEPAPASSAAPLAVPAPPPPADVQLNVEAQRFAARAKADAARPESGSDVLSARGRGTGQVSARNATAWDAAVLLDGSSGARGFFLRRGEQVTLLDVAPGTYGLRVMFGATWTGRAFAQGAAFFQWEEPVKIIGQLESAGARAPLIVLDGRAGMRPVAAFGLE
jgi:hypothetical protein